MADEGRHPPGFSPENDAVELVRMLEWIVAARDQNYTTTSCDVYCLGRLLAGIGLDFLIPLWLDQKADSHSVDENNLILSLSDVAIVNWDRTTLPSRHGMRVPLDRMEEVVSIWPGKNSDNNRRRAIFQRAMAAASGVQLRATSDPFGTYGLGMTGVRVISQPLKGRATNDGAWRLSERFLLANTQQSLEALEYLLKDVWKLQDEVGFLIAVALETKSWDKIQEEYICDFQCFVLGYYYAALKPLLDTSQLSVQEVFGDWGWYDTSIFDVIIKIANTPMVRDHDDHHGIVFMRHQITSLLAYLFIGSEARQRAQIDHRTIGVIGKLTLLNSSLLGQADTPEKVGKFVLMDIDASCMPSNIAGIIRPGSQPTTTKLTPQLLALSSHDTLLAKMQRPPDALDFTSHIEPDWEYDTQTCLVVYRYRGRLIHRINPRYAELAVLTWSTDTWKQIANQQEKLTVDAGDLSSASRPFLGK